ncbi:DHH family phosphoesterase [Mesoplasma lactucae]|uniref:Phosphoesterase n=1 Tax=Mesoplasma lactucae ATCC 49193 TaxID=81460 RepID=A0A291ISL9_9MOLU|nr:bifunctional oligoribonuclease/PAP phosphatase NrnA [Mesoplasma lactucae]ATG97760.1 phosphoesterase [Mesoplasma lactucae ATCC 49193]ATZ20463.1 DHH family protein [Mesoplasma lactucae ATCC 49193]MCL8216635.1 Bifunctional oligoribonuclease and PAP phosphatase NrnA [Mesoplasma lactucae ATCC 49193]
MKNEHHLDNKLNNLIKKYNTIIIAKHTNPDWDAQGSAIGLANIIQDNYKNKTVYVVGERLNDDESFSDDLLTNEAARKALLITVDTANVERVDYDQFSTCKEVFKIDHHLVVDEYGTYNMVDESAIACAQVVTLWAARMGLEISKTAAMNLYKGIVTDSGRFLFDKTDADTFDAAAILLEAGVDLNQVQKELYLSDLKMKEWQAKAFNTVEITESGIAHIVAKKKDYEEFNLDYPQVKSALGTMSGIKQIPIWFTVIEWDNEWKVSLRSREYDVNKVAKMFNGGGHKLASGAKLTTLDEIPKLIESLEKLLGEK